jgi:hypothetical protein
MRLLIDPQGTVHAIYGEEIDLGALGQLTIRRASHVEPDKTGRWWVDFSPIGGPRLGPYRNRTAALAAEQEWLTNHWLPSWPAAARPESSA